MKKHIIAVLIILILVFGYVYIRQKKTDIHTELSPDVQKYLANEETDVPIGNIPDLENPLDPAPLEDRIEDNNIQHHVTLTIYSKDKLNTAVINVGSPNPEKVIAQIKKGIYLGVIDSGNEDAMFGIPDADSELPIPTVLDPDVYFRIDSFDIQDDVAAFSVMFGE